MSKFTFSPDVARLNPGIASHDAHLPDAVRTIGQPRFRSALERRAWLEWVPSLGDDVVGKWWEPFSLSLHTEGVKLRRYTPDIVLRWATETALYHTPSHSLWIVEVKGAWGAYASGRSSKLNLEHAAAEYRDLGRWFVLMPDGAGGWALTEIVTKKEEA